MVVGTAVREWLGVDAAVHTAGVTERVAASSVAAHVERQSVSVVLEIQRPRVSR